VYIAIAVYFDRPAAQSDCPAPQVSQWLSSACLHLCNEPI